MDNRAERVKSKKKKKSTKRKIRRCCRVNYKRYRKINQERIRREMEKGKESESKSKTHMNLRISC